MRVFSYACIPRFFAAMIFTFTYLMTFTDESDLKYYEDVPLQTKSF